MFDGQDGSAQRKEADAGYKANLPLAPNDAGDTPAHGSWASSPHPYIKLLRYRDEEPAVNLPHD